MSASSDVINRLSDPDNCPKCNGIGMVSVYSNSVGGSVPCPVCEGNGKNGDSE